MKSLSDKKAISAVTLAFLASRIVYYWLGIRFGSIFAWQSLDHNLLKNDLVESIIHLHSQPPVMNLVLGVLLKVFGDNWMSAAHLIFIVLGLITAVSLYLLTQRLGLSKIWSLAVSLFFILTPSSILYENTFFYTYPTAALLVVAALFLHKFVSGWKLRDGIIFFSLAALVVLTRSLFHPIWFLAAALLLLLIFKEKYQRKLILLSLVIPFLFIGLWYGKNIYLFGVTQGSSWIGMNLSHLTIERISQKEKEALVQKGILSPVSLIGSFQPPSLYKKIFPVKETGIKVLDQESMNNIVYVPASKQLLKDSINLIMARPLVYLKSVAIAYYIYFLPSSNYSFLDLNRGKISLYNRLFNTVAYGKIFGNELINASLTLRSIFNLEWFVIISYLLMTVFVIKTRKLKPEYAAAILFMYGTILFVMIIGNFSELGENHRFRFMTDPLLFVMVGLILHRWQLASASDNNGPSSPPLP